MIQIDNNIILLQTSADAYDFEVFHTYRNELRYLYKGSENPLTGGEKIEVIEIPPGNWQFIGTTDEVSEGMAAKIVSRAQEGTAIGFRDYTRKHLGWPFNTALESYQSWLRANKIPTDTRFAILKLNT